MSVEENVWEGFVSSIISDNRSNGEDVLSPDDAEWVDSCLVNDLELSDSSWSAMQDALLDIISFETSSINYTSAAENDGFETGKSTDVLMSEEGDITSPVRTKYDPVTSEAMPFMGEINDTLASLNEKEETYFPRGFLLNDKSKIRDGKKGKKTEVGSDPSLTDETELSFNDIFKVWDLDTSVDEEGELVQQLEKILAESPLTSPLPLPSLEDSVNSNLESGTLGLTSPPLVLDDSVSSDLDSGTLDDLISVLADLSLHPVRGS